MNRIRSPLCSVIVLSWLLLSLAVAVPVHEVQQMLTQPMTVTGTYPHMHCFETTARAHKLPVALLLAVAKGESNFKARAVSHKNAVGVMQILWPGTAKDLGIHSKRQLYDPCTNIQAGGTYLAWLLERYDGNLTRALAAYNYGPGRISQHAPLPAGARDYVEYIYDKYLSLRPVGLEPVDGLGTPLILRPFVYRFYYYAKRSQADLARRAALEGVDYDIEKNGDGWYQVVAYYDGSSRIRRRIVRHVSSVTGFKVR